MVKTRLDWTRWIVVALLIVLGWFNYRGTIGYTMYMFGDPLEDMSHGWVVPLVSAYVMWAQRKKIAAAAGLPSWRGLLWVFLFMAVCWFGSRGEQSRLEQVSLIGMLWAVSYALWGRGVASLMLFPAAYLVFIIPVASYLDFFTIHLRILASSIATGILNGFGLSIERSGTALYSRVPGAVFNVDVADPCSGIRSLFAMMALTAAYAHFTQKTLLQKWALFAGSIPLAIIGNIFRIFSICLVANWFGQEAAMGFYHDYSGYVVFLVGVSLMVEAGVLIGKLDGAVLRWGFLPEWLRDVSATRAVAAEVLKAPRMVFVVVFGTLFLMAGLVVLKLGVPPPSYESADFVARSLPERISGFTGDVPWFCHNEQCLSAVEEKQLREKGKQATDGFVCPSCGAKMHESSLGEFTVLPKDTVILKRTYKAGDELVNAVSMVIAGRRRGSIHRPELCLPAQGFAMTDARRVAVHVAGGLPSKVRKITVQRADGRRFSLVYWFFCKNRESCSHTDRILSDIWDRSVHNRINRWVMVAVNVSSDLDSEEGMERFEKFLSELCPQIVRER